MHAMSEVNVSVPQVAISYTRSLTIAVNRHSVQTVFVDFWRQYYISVWEIPRHIRRISGGSFISHI